MTRQFPWLGWKLKEPFPVLAPIVVPGQCDIGYPYDICETDCKVLCFSNRSTLRHHLHFVTDKQIVDFAIILILGKAN